jgi:hypothetical protein
MTFGKSSKDYRTAGKDFEKNPEKFFFPKLNGFFYGQADPLAKKKCVNC